MARHKHTVTGVLYSASFSIDYSNWIKFETKGEVQIVGLNAFGYMVKDHHTAKWLVVIGKIVYLYHVCAKSTAEKIIVNPAAALAPIHAAFLRKTFETPKSIGV